MALMRTAVQSAIASVRAGRGRVVLLAGSAGSGLSHELSGAARQAGDSQLVVARARGREAERPLAFGVASELLAHIAETAAHSPLAGGAGRLGVGFVRGEVSAADPVGDGGLMLIRALWALTRAAERPTALVIDDLHDADALTLRWLAYVIARIDDQPLLVIAATRPEVASEDAASSHAIARAATRCSPAKLSARAAAALVRARLPGASDGLCAACLAATAANPGLLDALAIDLATPSHQDVDRVEETVGAAVAAVVAERVWRLPPVARTLAQAIADREPRDDLEGAISAAGLSRAEGAAATAALMAAGMLHDGPAPRLAQPVVGTALRSPPGEASNPGWNPPTAPRSAPTMARGGGVLTAAEQRVAGLAGRGMTTREIASTLFVTPKTVEFHLRNVYRKLQIPSSRSALALAMEDHRSVRTSSEVRGS